MSKHICRDCRIPIPHGQAVLRSMSLKRVAFCKPCAEDAGLIDFGRPVLQVVESS